LRTTFIPSHTKPLNAAKRRRNMEECMVKTLKVSKAIAFLLVLPLVFSFLSFSFSCAQAGNQFQASIWVDGGCGSSHSEGDPITIHFMIEAVSSHDYSSNARISIIDHYPNNAGSQYLIRDETCTINAICHYNSTVNCDFGGEGIEMLELIAEIYTSTGTITVGDTCSFYVHCSEDNTPPDISVVELVQPVNTVLSTRVPTFTWKILLTHYQEVASWTLEVASDIQMQQNRKTVTGLTNLSTIISGNYASVSYTLPTAHALTNGTWYWHVSAADAAHNDSAFTLVKSFVVNAREESPVKVTLVSPPNRFENTPSRPTFSWLQVQGATLYRLQVDNNSNFSSLEINQDSIATTSYMAPSDMEPGTYYWRVISNAANAEWSDTWSFTISEEIPKQVVLSSPSSGAQDMPITPLFQWQSLEGATSYTLEVSTSTSFTSLVVYKPGLTATRWGTASDWEANNPSQLEDGMYYWRVSSNLAGSTSAIWNFTVKKFRGGEIGITVHVSDLNGDPLAGAAIELTREGELAGTGSTDALGRATISGLESGTYTIEVRSTGYNTYTERVILSSDITKDITLYRGAVIHGYVYYDNTQNSAPNVAVRVYESQTQLQVVSDITDTNGYFIMDNIADNRVYYIVVGTYEDQKKQGIIAVDSPTTANALTILIKTEGEVIGVVQDEAGTPLPGAKVTVRDGEDQFVNSMSTNNIGSFTFKVTPGQYYVEVTVSNYEDYKGDVFTVEYKEIEDLGLITLNSQMGTLVVTVQNGGGPLDATVTVKDAAGRIINTITVTGGEGSGEISAGTYSLEANADKHQPQLVTGITIESGTTVFQDFILTPTSGSIEIYIIDTDGMPIFEAEIFLDGQSAGITNPIGELAISDVSPGNHNIYIVKENFRDYQEIWRVNPGETLKRNVTLEKSTNWLYILLVVLAVGAVIVALKFANPRFTVFTKGRTVAFCPYCGNKIRKNWSTCLYCGANLDKTRIYDDDTRIY
jgi:hypothetical protein